MPHDIWCVLAVLTIDLNAAKILSPNIILRLVAAEFKYRLPQKYLRSPNTYTLIIRASFPPNLKRLPPPLYIVHIVNND